MRAALDDLANHETEGRRIAVLGDMLELGPAEDDHHRDVGAYAATAGVDVLVTVGPRAVKMLDRYDGESYAVGDAARRPRWPASWSARATSCWSRARAASGSRSWPRPSPPRSPADGRGPDRGHRLAAHLHLPVAEVHRLPAPARVRPADPRGGAAGAPRQGGHADDGRDHHLHRHRGPVPAAHGVLRAGGGRVRRRRRVRAARVRRRLREGRAQALAGAAGADEADRHDPHRGRAVAGRDALGRAAGHREPADHRRVGRRRDPLSGVHLPGGGGHDLGGEPHRRARRPGGRLRGDRPARLHRDHVHHAPDRPRAGRGVPRRRLRRVPVVQLVPGLDLHGRHGLSGPGRRDRGDGGDDQDRGAPDHPRRDLRHRGAVGA